jgi:hypothetical protein
MHASAERPGGGNGRAVFFGVVATVVGAGLWAAVTAVTGHEFSLVAIGVGALIGLAMFAARPTSMAIAVVAALFTVVGCALGEFLAIPAYVAHKGRAAFSTVLSLETHHPKLFFDTLDGKTYLFWAIGAAAAFSMVYRRIQAARVASASSAAYGAAPQQPPGAPYPGPPQQQPYAPDPQPYGPGAQPYGPGPQQPYGGQPGPGQQYPPR